MKLPAIKTYWITWVMITSCLLLSKWAAVQLGLPSLREWIAFGYLILIWVPLMILTHFEQEPLRLRLTELRRTNPERKVPFPNLAAAQVIFAGETFGDDAVARLRKRLISFLKFGLFAFIAFAPAMIFLT